MIQSRFTKLHSSDLRLALVLCLFQLLFLANISTTQADEPTFQQVNKILTKYCAGCHNADESSGEFALHTFSDLIKGGESGNALTPGSSVSSRMIQLINGKLEPAMPPDGEARPTDDEIQLIADWIDAGATGPKGESINRSTMVSPQIKSNVNFQPITAMALSPDESILAVAGFRKIQFFDTFADLSSKSNPTPSSTFEELPGKVTSLAFLDGGKQILAGTGTVGLNGEALLIDVAENKIIRRFQSHSDMVYSVTLSPDGKQFATAGYDKKAVLWNLDSTKPVREFTGHNDSIFSCTFDQSGERLITASADATVKVWKTEDGTRLDTRGEPLKEQYSLALSTDGESFFAGGEDNRIRKWKLVSADANQTNPLEIARFAHETAIQVLQVAPFEEFDLLFSVAADGTIKIWDCESLNELHSFPSNSAAVQAIAISAENVFVGRIDGTIERIAWPDAMAKTILSSVSNSEASKKGMLDAKVANNPMATTEKSNGTETEPNNSPGEAQSITAPFEVTGAINSDDQTDVDYFKFAAKKGQRLIVETRSSQDKSPLDTKIAVLDSDGNPIPRVLLQAVRDSYFTFRGKNSTQTGDFRIHNWEEMKLGQLLYCNGEVVKLYHYPRGPDSGYNVYPNFGNRHGMFDTTSIAHALQEPCYVVEAHQPGTKLPASGLPQFLLNYENDDDGERELGTDSRLTFTAPGDGDYIVRVKDSRDFQGEKYKYTLRVRPEDPSFKMKSVSGKDPTLIRGGYKKIVVTLDRIDNFSGAVDLTVDDLPEGIIANGPMTVEEGNLRAFLTLFVAENAPVPAEDAMTATITATATIDGKVVRSAQSLGKIKFESAPKLTVELLHSPEILPHFNQERLPVFEIHPGETITARVKAVRRGHNGRINFGKEEATLNLPLGIYVSNTGLNGVLIPPDKTERTFTIQAEEWVKPSERLIFLEAEEAGKPSSNPAVLRVLPTLKPPGNQQANVSQMR